MNSNQVSQKEKYLKQSEGMYNMKAKLIVEKYENEKMLEHYTKFNSRFEVQNQVNKCFNSKKIQMEQMPKPRRKQNQ